MRIATALVLCTCLVGCSALGNLSSNKSDGTPVQPGEQSAIEEATAPLVGIISGINPVWGLALGSAVAVGAAALRKKPPTT